MISQEKIELANKKKIFSVNNSDTFITSCKNDKDYNDRNRLLKFINEIKYPKMLDTFNEYLPKKNGSKFLYNITNYLKKKRKISVNINTIVEEQKLKNKNLEVKLPPITKSLILSIEKEEGNKKEQILKNCNLIPSNINFIITKENNPNLLHSNKSELNKSILPKHRGRKPTTTKEQRTHSYFICDNLNSKLQVHYFSFIIKFCNDLTNSFFNIFDVSLQYKDINYHYKQNITNQYINKLKTTKIGDILQLEISSKYKFKNSYNKNIYSVLNNIHFFNSFYQLYYIDVFIDYYCIKKPNYLYKGIIIRNSFETKFFQDLIEKNKKCALNLYRTKDLYIQKFIEKTNFISG